MLGHMIELTEEMRERIGGALMEGNPVIAASVEANGQPTIAFYGTAQVYSADQLAIWVKNPEAGLLKRLPTSSRMAFLYRNPQRRIGWQFHGRARVAADPEVRATVFANAPELERQQDPEQLGTAVLIDIDRVIARGQTLMERDAPA